MIYEDRFLSETEKKAKKTLGVTFLPKDVDAGILQTIAYEYPKRKINVELTTNEFTCICPFSGLPDFAVITIRYTPRAKLIELKSLKYYLYAYRNVKIYNEHAVNKILEDVARVLHPYQMTVVGEFTARGGATNKVTAEYKKK
ncbi:MAG: preQ(1) synthase [Candidatus Omnitrophica bacterium]|nr:preQ(1) synthase [Candidatus Omnitrophota bacterium]